MIVQKPNSNKKSFKFLSVGLFVFIFLSIETSQNIAHANMFTNAFESIKTFINKDKNETLAVRNDEEVVLRTYDTSSASSGSKGEMLKSSVGLLRADFEEEVPQNDSISVYEVKKGDTIGDIAKLYNVSKNTIIWANDLKGKNIKEGDSILILPVSGVKYTVKKGDTLKSIAKKHKAETESISDFNSLAVGESLNIGDELIIPDGEIVDEAPVKKPAASIKAKAKRYLVSNTAGYYMRPLIGGVKTQGIHGQNAVDIATPKGSPLLAAADGVVLAAKSSGYNGGYGMIVIISHPNGTQTIYAHMSSLNVSAGDRVIQGQVIGASGNSGKSTGPHLHFEIRGAENPF